MQKMEINVSRLDQLFRKNVFAPPSVWNLLIRWRAAFLFCAFNLDQDKLTWSYALSFLTGVTTNFDAPITLHLSIQTGLISRAKTRIFGQHLSKSEWQPALITTSPNSAFYIIFIGFCLFASSVRARGLKMDVSWAECVSRCWTWDFFTHMCWRIAYSKDLLFFVWESLTTPQVHDHGGPLNPLWQATLQSLFPHKQTRASRPRVAKTEYDV